ncbi:MAG: hypothetical protein FJ077_12300 [Cyanobacteria bacterium K_DeepCast_35m_m2_023]|nr:hypothetical protein [Cyanobacteria bacterium K_DeepCast_35m_m2_023]
MINGTTTLSSGTGSITLLDRGNRFGVTPLTINSSGTVQIVPCSAINRCGNQDGQGNAQAAAAQARQDLLSTNAGLAQNSQLGALMAAEEADGRGGRALSANGRAQPATDQGNTQRFDFGASSLEVNTDRSTCASAGGCNLNTSTNDANGLAIDGQLSSGGIGARLWNALVSWRRGPGF